MLVTEMYFAIDTCTGFVDLLALYALKFVESVVDLYFFAIFWVCDVYSAHCFGFELCFDYYYKVF